MSETAKRLRGRCAAVKRLSFFSHCKTKPLSGYVIMMASPIAQIVKNLPAIQET